MNELSLRSEVSLYRLIPPGCQPHTTEMRLVEIGMGEGGGGRWRMLRVTGILGYFIIIISYLFHFQRLN